METDARSGCGGGGSPRGYSTSASESVVLPLRVPQLRRKWMMRHLHVEKTNVIVAILVLQSLLKVLVVLLFAYCSSFIFSSHYWA